MHYISYQDWKYEITKFYTSAQLEKDIGLIETNKVGKYSNFRKGSYQVCV